MREALFIESSKRLEGRDFEEMMCGRAVTQGLHERLLSDELRHWRRYADEKSQNKYRKPNAAEKLAFFPIVKKLQPWTEQNIPKEIPFAAIRTKVENLLHTILSPQDFVKYRNVRYYTAVDTPLDDGGVDAFIEIGDMRLTIDVTLEKDEKAEKLEKADIVLTEDHTPRQFKNEAEKNQHQYDFAVDTWSHTILKAIQDKLAQRKQAQPAAVSFVPRTTREEVLERARARMVEKKKRIDGISA